MKAQVKEKTADPVTSISDEKKAEAAKMALRNEPKGKRRRLHELYAEFPFLQGLSLNQCLLALSDLISKHILNEADTNKDNLISFDEFEVWANKGLSCCVYRFTRDKKKLRNIAVMFFV